MTSLPCSCMRRASVSPESPPPKIAVFTADILTRGIYMVDRDGKNQICRSIKCYPGYSGI
jgi:hypothetical protein